MVICARLCVSTSRELNSGKRYIVQELCTAFHPGQQTSNYAQSVPSVPFEDLVLRLRCATTAGKQSSVQSGNVQYGATSTLHASTRSIVYLGLRNHHWQGSLCRAQFNTLLMRMADFDFRHTARGKKIIKKSIAPDTAKKNTSLVCSWLIWWLFPRHIRRSCGVNPKPHWRALPLNTEQGLEICKRGCCEHLYQNVAGTIFRGIITGPALYIL